MSRLSPADRSRSPRFPSHSLEQAIEFTKKIYEGVHRSPVDSLSAMQLMGFTGKNGASATALGSIRQFGLIEGTGDKTRVSALALKILEPIDQHEMEAAVNEAASYPAVFGQILGRFDGRLPSANEPIRAFLIRELGFSKSGADDCLEAIRATLQFKDGIASSATESKFAAADLDAKLDLDRSPKGARETAESSFGVGHSLHDASDEHMLIPLTRECKASLRFHGTVSEKAISNLMKHIELMKEVWAES